MRRRGLEGFSELQIRWRVLLTSRGDPNSHLIMQKHNDTSVKCAKANGHFCIERSSGGAFNAKGSIRCRIRC